MQMNWIGVREPRDGPDRGSCLPGSPSCPCCWYHLSHRCTWKILFQNCLIFKICFCFKTQNETMKYIPRQLLQYNGWKWCDKHWKSGARLNRWTAASHRGRCQMRKWGSDLLLSSISQLLTLIAIITLGNRAITPLNCTKIWLDLNISFWLKSRCC